MYYGYTGTILRVNLTHGEVTKEASISKWQKNLSVDAA